MKKILIGIVFAFSILAISCNTSINPIEKIELEDSASDGSGSETTEGESTEGESTEGESTEGESTEGESTEGETTEGESTEGESTEGESTEGESTESESIDETEDTSSGEAYVASNSIYLNLSNSTCSEDNSTWSTISTSKMKILNNTSSIKFTKDDESTSTGLIKIDLTDSTENIAVYMTGTMTTGGIKIQTNPSYEVGIYLNGVSIQSSNYPAIEVTKGGPTTVFLSGTNTLTDGRNFGTGYGAEYSTSSSDTYEDDDGNIVSCTVVQSAVKEGSDSKGTLYSKGSMSICGTGSLTVTESYKNCIASKSYLTIESGTLNLTSKGKSGLFADCGITVKDGNITYSGTGEISSSEFHKAHGLNVDNDTYSDSFVKILGGNLDLTAYNGKGITAPIVLISDGTISVNSTGVTNYTNDNNQTSTYYDADGVKHSNESVTFSAEGIEGESSVTITGGTIEIIATDDAVNISDTGASFKMSDGMLYAYSEKGDAIDSNGNIAVSGGTIVAYAPTGSEDALDCGDGNYSITISGGTIAGVCGSSNGISEISTTGSQRILYATGSSSSMGGFSGGRPGSSSSSGSTTYSNVVVQVSSTTKLCFTVPSSSFGLITLTSPDFTSSSSSSYSIYPAATISGGEAFHGLYTTLPTVSSTGSSTTMSVK